MALSVSATTSLVPPRVDLSVSGVAATAVSLVVTRSAGGESWQVRGTEGVLVAGSAQVADLEVPVGAAVSYAVHAFDASGAQVDAGSVSVAALDPGADSSLWWLSDPLDQTSPMLVQVMYPTDAERTWDADVALAHPFGSRYPIVSSSTRTRGPLTLVLDAEIGNDSTQLRAMLEQALVLCVRHTDPGHELEPVIYGVPSSMVENFDHAGGWTRFTVELLRSRGTRLAPTVYAWTYADLLAQTATYADVVTTWTDYEALVRGNA